jgi:hypothetical protein
MNVHASMSLLPVELRIDAQRVALQLQPGTLDSCSAAAIATATSEKNGCKGKGRNQVSFVSHQLPHL